MIINHNMMAMNTHRKMGINQGNSAKSIEKLSSGLRINKAGDDAAGLAISEKMRAQIRGLDQSSRNAQDAISLIQTAEGALNETHSILQRMRELGVQAANSTNVDSDRSEIQKEINQLTSEVNRIGNTTEFNTQKLLDGGSGHTGKIRYSTATQGVAEVAATGDMSAVTTVTGSVEAGTVAVSAVTKVTDSVDSLVDATGTISSPFETQESIKGGTGSTQLFQVDTESVKAATAATIGSGGAGLEEITASAAGGTAAIQGDQGLEVVKGAAAVAGDAYALVNFVETQASDATHNQIMTVDFDTLLTDGINAGDTITFGGTDFTAKASGAGVNEFNIGHTKEETIANLAEALNDSASIVGNTGSNVEVTSAGTVATFTVEADNENMKWNATEITANTVAKAQLSASAREAVYTLEVSENFTEGDKITIGGTTYTATATGVASNDGANTFEVKGTIAETVDELMTAIGADHVANYAVSQDAPDWLWTDDTTSITFTANAAAVDANAAQFTTFLSVDQADAEQGEYKFELENNFEVGATLTIDGQEFTAVAVGDITDASKQFEVGTTINDTADNIVTAMKANATLNGKYDIDTLENGAGTFGGTSDANDGDTILMQEKLTSGQATIAVTSADLAEVQGKFSFEIKDNFSVGDEIEVDGVTFTATSGANSATEFQVGADVAATADNLAKAIELSSLNTHYTANNIAGSFGDNRVQLTEIATQADGTDMASGDVTVTPTPEQAGVSTFSLVQNFTAGETFTVDGETFTAVASGADSTKGEFNVGATTALTAGSLETALNDNATVGAHYTVGLVGSDFTMTEKANQADGSAAPTIGATSPVGETQGEYTFKLTANASVGDKITIEGQEFEGVSGVAGANQFTVGADIGTTTDNLITAIKGDAVIGEAARFTATKVTDNTDPLNPVYTIKMTEQAGLANGDNTVTAVADQVDEVAGVYTVDVDTNFAAKDKLNIGGVTLTAGTENTATTFAVGADAEETATNIAAAVNLNDTLKAHYTAASSGDSIALTEKAGEATAVALTDPTVDGDATQGQFEFGMSALTAGSTVTIDGTELTLASGGTESETAADLKTALENDATLNAKYSVAVSGSDVTLTQKAGQESANAPTLSYETQAGDGFNAQMQIGANTGQSFSVDMNDMRASALGASSSTGAAGQTVTVDNLEYAVEWTDANTVTNGTDNIAVEYALDVSNHDNATAAVKVIDDAINAVSAERSKLGAFQNRLEHTINNLNASSENLTASESRIRDVDMAKEMMNFTKNNILQQAAQSMLAQANQAPQGVLQLLR